MDASLVVTGAMALLKPLLEKASEKAAETIGEKFAEKTVQKTFWHKIKGLFIIEKEKRAIESIENKSVASVADIAYIENKLKIEIEKNPDFINSVKETLNINFVNEALVKEKFISIQRLQDEIKQLETQMERAGIATSGDYMNRIELQTGKLYYQISEVLKILNKK